MFDVIIIGCGFSGVFAALKLPTNLNILLIEQGAEILPITSSSYNQCYKLHTGLHYAKDIETAEICLRHAIEFAKEYPQFIAGNHDPWSPWRRGRHYFMSTSSISREDAERITTHLQRIYSDLPKEDQVFGDPEHFMKFIDPIHYPHIEASIPVFNKDEEIIQTSVLFGVETGESQIDIDPLKAHLKEQISKRENITFLPNTSVTNIAYHPTQFGYIVSSVNRDNHAINFETVSIINCAWDNIEKLDRKIGFDILDENRVIRVKASTLVQLPQELQNMNTCIFSSGPFCSITVLPGSKAILTSEHSTNLAFFNAGLDSPPEEIQKLLDTMNLHHPAGLALAQQIRQECAAYLTNDLKNLLIDAPILELRFGFVKIIENNQQYTSQSIYEDDSAIHARKNTGIEVRDLGYISNSGMKMTYTLGNAVNIEPILTEHLKIMTLAEKIKTESPLNQIHKDLFLTIYRNSLKEILTSNKMKENYEECIKKISLELLTHFGIKSQSVELIPRFNFFKEENASLGSRKHKLVPRL